nr:MAG TPA: hypothetical protein [Caudoviricetes sp.]
MWHYLPSVLPTIFRRVYKCRYLNRKYILTKLLCSLSL